ncbi:hypothetical protein AMAG_12032 [Allomyces macrogynus ATCC 38327]|uniref:Uncharacterized protein n=1 Tax=Allomyces macrogynus (strain ATCC 38327) TaxID=578462 RepID=A0A0L0SYV0_ALLM3|nr:hypothetical protein AMAG_12032 [Allomyces macrogynus ATCC 38327]|eukprot:KNE67580.1 hypothetical protein AMAG_12032 [Allomyces macrogynus ATCC 38327]
MTIATKTLVLAAITFPLWASAIVLALSIGIFVAAPTAVLAAIVGSAPFYLIAGAQNGRQLVEAVFHHFLDQIKAMRWGRGNDDPDFDWKHGYPRARAITTLRVVFDWRSGTYQVSPALRSAPPSPPSSVSGSPGRAHSGSRSLTNGHGHAARRHGLHHHPRLAHPLEDLYRGYGPAIDEREAARRVQERIVLVTMLGPPSTESTPIQVHHVPAAGTRSRRRTRTATADGVPMGIAMQVSDVWVSAGVTSAPVSPLLEGWRLRAGVDSSPADPGMSAVAGKEAVGVVCATQSHTAGGSRVAPSPEDGVAAAWPPPA